MLVSEVEKSFGSGTSIMANATPTAPAPSRNMPRTVKPKTFQLTTRRQPVRLRRPAR
jgi:hypothetical protein